MSESKKLVDENIQANQEKNDKNKLSVLANSIKTIIVVNGGKPIKMEELIQKLKDEDRGKFFSQEELGKSIEELTKIAPKWIKKVGTGKANFIKVEKTVNMADVIKTLENMNSVSAQ